MLRPESGRVVELIPPPSLDGLSRLAEEAEEAGVPTTIQVDGARPSVVPPGLDLCAYRIVQEALTNVIKHAPDARAQVSVTWHAEGLTVEVTDNGAGAGLLGDAIHGPAAWPRTRRDAGTRRAVRGRAARRATPQRRLRSRGPAAVPDRDNA